MEVKIGILSTSEVKEHLHDDAPYSIIDARPYTQYMAGHIAGAVWMGWEDWCEDAPDYAEQILTQAGYWGVLKESANGSLQEPLRQLGLSNERPVLVYADGLASKGREGRIAWMLLYWGLSSVFLLDGGWSAWLKMRGSGEVATQMPRYGQFTINTQEERRVYLSQLRQELANDCTPILIDTRSQAEFSGLENSYQPRMGRIPGSISIPYTDLFDETGNFVSKDIYLQRLPVGVRDAKRCIAYCEVGIRSGLFALLHEAYTGQIVANYDGSIMEWGLEKELPMECDYLLQSLP